MILGFSDEDKKGTIQPHDDALVVTLRIGGFDVRRVLVDPGSTVEVMYPDLYKGLNLRPEDLTAYDSPLISFEGKIVIPKKADQTTHTDWVRGGGGELYRGRCLLALHSDSSQAMDPCPRSRIFHTSPKGKIHVQRPSGRDSWRSGHGQAVYGGRHLTSVQCRVLGF